METSVVVVDVVHLGRWLAAGPIWATRKGYSWPIIGSADGMQSCNDVGAGYLDMDMVF